MKPFSKENTYYDSSMYLGKVVEHTTSWLTINPYKGCSLKCAYCFRVNWEASETPLFETDLETAVEKLLSHDEFVPNITPISINISSTDALLPRVRQSTFDAVKMFESKKLRNPFGITTKLGFKKVEINYLSKLRYVRPIIFVSLAMMPRNIEPISTKPRIQNLKWLSETQIPTVLYYRPIVKNWNDSDEIIEQILLLTQKFAGALCIGSLRLSPEIRKELELANAKLDLLKNDFHEKDFDKELEQRILNKYEQMGITKPLFKHTSCAVSFFLEISNYNQLYKNPERNCLKTCPMHQQILCNSSE